MSRHRAELYGRLPVTASDRWWLELATASGGGHVVEFGAGAGRLTAALVATGARVTAVEHDPDMLTVLRDRIAGAAQVVAADVADPPPLPQADLVVLPSSLLNELPDATARRAVVTAAARCCRRGGRVALHVLGPRWLIRLAGRAAGSLVPLEGGDPVEVTISAGGFDGWRGRRAATLTYTFADGTSIDDHLDAAVVTTAELESVLPAAGLQIVERWGARPGTDAPSVDAPALHLCCRAA